MAYNTNEEHLDSSTNIQAENPSNEITPAKDTQAIPPNQETETMEVHKHPHHVTHKKKFSEYLLEFLMLFLAVFLGFLAESYHVHLLNKDIEKRNIESYISSIQKDSTSLVRTIARNEAKIKTIDSLAKIPGNFADTPFQSQFFKYAVQLVYVYPFLPEESAFLQMQSSGTLRLIKNQNITDSILNYQSRNATIKSNQGGIDHTATSAMDNLIQITDWRKFDSHRLNNNNQQIQAYINNKLLERGEILNNMRFFRDQLLRATRLISFLKKQYDIE